MSAQKFDYSQLYRGATPDFNEVEYLTDASRIIYEIRNLLKKYDMLKKGSEEAYLAKFTHGPVNTPDALTRINKNGAFAIEFVGRVPSALITPYGEVPLHHGHNNYLFDNAQNEAKFTQELNDLFGLVPMKARTADGKSQCRPAMMAITRLPWKAKAQIPVSAETYHITEIEHMGIGYREEISHMKSDERDHVRKVLQVVNAKFIKDHHPEYVYMDEPGTLAEMVQTNPHAVDQLEASLNADYQTQAPMISTVDREI